MPTPTEHQAAILAELGLTSDTVASEKISYWWSLFSSAASEELQALLTKRRVLFYKIVKAAGKYDVTIGGDSMKKSQTASNLLKLLKVIDEEIETVEPGYFTPFIQSSYASVSYPDALEEAIDSYSCEYTRL